uniref:Uncharacterized protein n=2 Tax=Aegilops tauschii subsp. strangulata TaxID=200361 RepID=A0A453L138_AEGTS
PSLPFGLPHPPVRLPCPPRQRSPHPLPPKLATPEKFLPISPAVGFFSPVALDWRGVIRFLRARLAADLPRGSAAFRWALRGTMLTVKSEPATAMDAVGKSKIEEHEQKVNRYQAELAARIKAKYFSNKAFDGGKIFEEETIVEGETIRSSRCVFCVLLCKYLKVEYSIHLHCSFVGGHVQVRTRTR